MPETMPGPMGSFGPPMGSFGPLMFLVIAALIVVPFWFIFKKTGRSPWLSLLMAVPVVNVVMLYYLAFSAWPSLRERKTRQG